MSSVETEAGFKAALAAGGWDLIIADYNLPSFNAVVALRLLQQSGMDLPFIIVSGAIGEEVAVGAMKSGAHDYILKDSLARLVPAVERELRDVRARRERKLAEEELRNSREQLRALAAHLQSVREEERKLITREIHDELGQSLTGFKMDLTWIRNRLQSGEDPLQRQPLLDKISGMGKLLDDTAHLMRKLCTELRPGVLDDLGLTAAIEWQAREYQNRTGIKCEVQLESDDLIVDPERSTALFRIFQEILTNVARHARATLVKVTMKTTGSHIVLKVKDNGKGITEREKIGAKSLGLLGMRERAFILGGEVDIQGAPGKGTTISVNMPLPQFNPESVAAKEDAGCAKAEIPHRDQALKHKIEDNLLNTQKPWQPERGPLPGTQLEPIVNQVRILVVDDHVIIRQGLKQILAEAFSKAVFGEANNGNEALEQIEKQLWDVVLLDITMPGKGGLDVLKQIVSAQPNLAVLVLSMHPEDQYALRALKSGAAGYLTKNIASEEVVGAVKKVLAGGKYVSAALAEELAANLNTPAVSAPHETLSDREFQVMRLIALGKGVKEIGFELSLSVKTISTYRTRLLQKMKLKTNAEIIRYAMHEKLVE